MICSDKAWALIQRTIYACYHLADGTGSLENLDKELVELAEYIKKLEDKEKPSQPVKEKEGCTCKGVPMCNYCVDLANEAGLLGS